ncbi:ATP-dependent DNA helicase [Sphaerotilaceae bacterium SBD11-9]
MSTRPYVVAVRALCEFTAKAGDLDLRFTPSPTAQEGQLGHAVVAGRRKGAHYQAELSLTGEYRQLSVRGRADGYDAALNRLEEIKTHRGDLARLPANHRALHWAQAKVYAWLQCQKLALPEMQVALVYFDIGTQQETVLCETHTAAALQRHFEQQCERFLQWAEQELAHRAVRDEALTALRFPHESFRAGQRELAEAVYRAASRGRCLMAQAPTGIGKTVGTLFPLLKAAPGQALDKVFFLTAKGSGRQLALDAAERIQAGGKTLRVLELVARDKACEHPDKACHGDSCPLAKGFYDRLPAARAAAVGQATLDKRALREIALQHQVCPYYLSQELARWADVVVGDYNYYFDLSALLHSLAQANQWRVGVLVDEAHNLVERARDMYSAELGQADFNVMRKAAPPALKAPLAKLHRAWSALAKAQTEPYQVHAAVPEAFSTALQKATAAITEHLAEHPTEVNAELQRFYFDALHFAHVLELFDTHSLFDITLPAPRSSLLCLRNVVPAPHLQPRFGAAHSVALFSATLTPQRFHADTLGLPGDTAWVDVPTPFSPEQLQVRVAEHISTRYQHREASLAPMAALMADQYATQPGNYLAFFSSYDYLHKALAEFRALAPQVPVWEQSRRMGEAEREQFLARFTADSQGIGFAVLGGSFAEGVDLPGRRLIGAFIATLGLPQLNPVNEQIKQRLGERFGEGCAYDYAYLYPGIQKVVQAAGRVIRTPADRGVVCLIDDRFAQAKVRRLLPGWWQIGRTGREAPLTSSL